MSRSVKQLIGLATVIQFPAIVLLTVLEDPSIWMAVPVALIYWGLWIFYLLDIRKNSNVPAAKERLWWWTIFLTGAFAEPFYFWRFVWPEEVV